MGILFLFLACGAFKEREKKFLIICIFLAHACNTHVMFSIVAFSLFISIIVEKLMILKKLSGVEIAGCLIFLTGVGIMVLQVLPPDDTKFFNHVHETPLHEKFTKGFIALFKGLLTIPDFTSIHFWNSNYLVNLSKPLASVLGVVVYVLPLFLFLKKLRVLLFVYLALLGIQIFFFITQLGATRYDGLALIIIIVALWISNYYPDEKNWLSDYLKLFNTEMIGKPVMYVILLIQFGSGIYAFGMDYRYRFSGSKDAAEYLISIKDPNTTIVSGSCEGTSLSPYLQEKVWTLCTGTPESFCRWNSICTYKIEKDSMLPVLARFMLNRKKALCVLNDSIPYLSNKGWQQIDKSTRLRFLKKYDENVVRKSNYFIYEIVRTNGNQ